MFHLTSVFTYLPISFGILGAVIWYHRFHTVILPQAGKGSDAAGSGMAKGLASLVFFALAGVFLSLLLASGILLFIDSPFPRLQTALNVSLFMPLCLFGLTKLGELTDTNHENFREAASYEKWHALAQTRTFVDSKDRFRFRYATFLKGTFNTSYFEKTELFVTEDSVALLDTPDGGQKVNLLGKVSALAIPTSEVSSMTSLQRAIEERISHPCQIEIARDHPLKQFMGAAYTVYTLRFSAKDVSCLEAYARHERSSNPKLGEFFHFGNREIFFVTNSANPSLALEIVIAPHELILLGPLELNRSSESKADWYETIEIGAMRLDSEEKEAI